ncbi:unnamed protein product [Peronospora destructor]|uniref:Uncharacterized protein n=1 Tax=Peronospora destructor TaxID=86335 RepID=A0AAV0TTX2_9STRA|nr:unnamed protein product [Peronospora destructor]
MPSTECPICLRHVRLENLPPHGATCLTKQQLQLPTPRSDSSNSALKKRKRSDIRQLFAVPLAERMRPKNMGDLLGPGSLLATSFQQIKPPGCGKTTLTSVTSKETGFVTVSGTAKAGEMKGAVNRAKENAKIVSLTDECR